MSETPLSKFIDSHNAKLDAKEAEITRLREENEVLREQNLMMNKSGVEKSALINKLRGIYGCLKGDNLKAESRIWELEAKLKQTHEPNCENCSQHNNDGTCNECAGNNFGHTTEISGKGYCENWKVFDETTFLRHRIKELEGDNATLKVENDFIREQNKGLARVKSLTEALEKYNPYKETVLSEFVDNITQQSDIPPEFRKAVDKFINDEIAKAALGKGEK